MQQKIIAHKKNTCFIELLHVIVNGNKLPNIQKIDVVADDAVANPDQVFLSNPERYSVTSDHRLLRHFPFW